MTTERTAASTKIGGCLPSTESAPDVPSAACLRYHEWSLQRRAATYCDCWSCYGRYADRAAAGKLRPEDPLDADGLADLSYDRETISGG